MSTLASDLIAVPAPRTPDPCPRGSHGTCSPSTRHVALLHGAFFLNDIPNGYGHNLPFIYLMWITAVLILYLPCRWWAGLKKRREDWWLSYL